MPTRKPEETTPDVFSASPTSAALGSENNPVRQNLASQPRYLLPRDLAGALERLNDTDVDTLLLAVTREAKRRGRPQTGSPSKTLKSLTKRATAEDGSGSLTKGQLNAVHAAFKAGVKPPAIARQFGISQSDVRNALATEGRKRKP